MAIRVEIDGKGRVAEFPDGTDPAIIDKVIKRDFFSQKQDSPSYTEDPAKIERARREFVRAEKANLGTGEKLKMAAADVADYFRIPNQTSVLKDPLKVLPKSLANTLYSLNPGAAYEGLSPEAIAGSFPGGNPSSSARKELRLADLGTVKSMAAPFGLAGLDAAKESWDKNPVGSALMTVPIAKPVTRGTLRTLGKTAETVGNIIPTPEKLYASAIKPSKKLSMADKDAIIHAGLEGGYTPSKKGLDKLYDDINDINGRISNAISQSARNGNKIKVDDIISRLDDVKQRAIDSFGDNNTVLSKIDDYAQSLKDHPSVANGELPIDVAQKMKVNTYKQLKNAYGELKGFEVEAKKAMARGAKEEIVSHIPELAELNAKDSTLIKLENELFKAANRIQDRDMMGIGVPIKTAAGAFAGPKGALAGALLGIIDTPSIKANIAIAMHRARGRAATVKEVNGAVSQIKESLQNKLKDERGLVGRDIDGKVTPELKRWANGSRVTDETGAPKVLYHGTPEGKIEKFSQNTSADIDGYYFAVNPETTEPFSMGEFKQDLKRTAGQIGNIKAPTTYPVYLNIKNPLDFTKEVSHPSIKPFADAVSQLDDLSKELVLEALQEGSQAEKLYDIAKGYYADADKSTFGEYYTKKYGDIDWNKLSEIEKEKIDMEFYRIAEKNAAKKATDLMKKSGYDGVFRPDSFRAQNPDGKFNPLAKMRVKGDHDTYIAFYPHQIKSAIGNNGKFGKNDLIGE